MRLVVLLCAAIAAVCCHPVLPEAAVSYLTEFGFLPERSDNHTLVDRTAALRNLQAELGLPQTGVYDAQVAAVISTPRCGRAPSWGTRRWRRHATLGSRWRLATLSYRITKYSKDLPRAAVDAAWSWAIGEVSRVTRLQFAEAPPESTRWNLEIRFEENDHGCGHSFGPLALAHAMAPLDGGDIHVNDSYDFTVYSLNYVFLHELCHALGVAHTTELDAVMYPVYRDAFSGKSLFHSDDLRVLHLLYSNGEDTALTGNFSSPGAP